jgi:hypothetical protein
MEYILIPLLWLAVIIAVISVVALKIYILEGKENDKRDLVTLITGMALNVIWVFAYDKLEGIELPDSVLIWLVWILSYTAKFVYGKNDWSVFARAYYALNFFLVFYLLLLELNVSFI